MYIRYQNTDMNCPVENVFDIEPHGNYTYTLGKYQPSLSRLEVLIAPVQGFDIVSKIVFTDLLYIQVCRFWKNAHFSLLPPQQCISLVRRFSQYEYFTDKGILENFVLCGASSEDKIDIHILAATAERIEIK